ncbi:relaxase/mobilization nuclease domain-containing protein [Psychrobacter sp. 4Bb]|uniref:relaxase/mobilization nuclease domain-containing protein n=1 Tax=Psychrobacter sp. 4Bb TaxID=888436 RepID=UPI000C7C8367|nr:relaxase/mobilization nuclease domain-containing protein [Psychrobacter sp. 4Bb]PKH79981.1 hypothetical protein CXF60_11045 [Psychrobacter sp. 4Bb]
MLVSFNRRGGTKDNRKSSGGRAVRDYLLGKDNNRRYARVLKGEPEVTTEVINGLNFAKIYTSGVLAFDYGEGDKLNDKKKLEIIDSFEQTLFPNLAVNQYTGYWVEHTDKVLIDQDNNPILDEEGKKQRRLELNFVFANVELTSGKALPVYFHRNDVNLVDSWRDVINATYSLADPNHPKRRRVLATVSDLPKSTAEVREDIHDFIISGIEKGYITNRHGILKAFASLGLVVARETKTSISIENPDGKNNIRFKGEIYEREFEVEKFSRAYSKSESSELRENTIDLKRARERLLSTVANRSSRISKRFDNTTAISSPRTGTFNFSSLKIDHDINNDPIPGSNHVINKRINLSLMEAVRPVAVDNNDSSNIDVSTDSLEDEHRKRLDRAILTFIKIFTDESISVRSDWLGNGSTGTLVPNETKAKFDSRQLGIIKNIEELHSYSSEKRVREVLSKPKNNSIVALLIDPIVEREQYEIRQLTKKNNNIPAITQEAEASPSPKSIIKSPVLESQYPKYTP